jgi:hypothetical protein
LFTVSFNASVIFAKKDLEVARHNLNCKYQLQQNVGVEEQPVENNEVLFFGFGEEEEDGEEFTPVLSRKTMKKMKSSSKILRSLETNR